MSTIGKLLKKYFQTNPDKELSTGEITDWIMEKYFDIHGKIPKDVGRDIRHLGGAGFISKVRKGVWKYSADEEQNNKLVNFSKTIIEAIFYRDGYKCVFCGRGKEDGVEICADHIYPRSKGGKSTIENGQTLCYEHNTLKNDYSQLDAGKIFFEKMYEVAKREGDSKMIEYCESIFTVYDEFGSEITILDSNRQKLANLELFFENSLDK